MLVYNIIQTEDGSHSLHSNQFEVAYHSIHGAIQEAQTIFIDAALNYKAQSNKKLHILEIGFGTGLNAFMTYLEAQKQDLDIFYTAIEAYPISIETAQQLNFARLLDAEQEQQQLLKMHEAKSEEIIRLSPNFLFQKKIDFFQNIQDIEQFDIIYFDAFAPSAQPELWESPLLSKMYFALKEEGVLTTYCAQGVFKRCLKSLGFKVEGLPGPIGKREMTRCFRTSL